MKYLIKSLLFFCLFILASSAFSQGVSNYNLYNVNTYAINPAYVGSQDGIFTLLHFKNHLAGINNGPRNLMFVVHSPIGKKLGLGGDINEGQGGVFKSTSANLASSYKVNITADHRVTFGLSGGFFKQTLDVDKLKDADLSDPTLQTNYSNKVYYKFGFGAVYNWKGLEVSLALPNLKQEEHNLLSKYFIGYATYKYYTKDNVWKIQPSVLYKSIPVSPNQVDVYLTGEWKKLLWATAGYRNNHNLIIGGGLTIENMNIGYAYQAPMGITRSLSKGTHEIVFSFLIRNKPKKSISEKEEANPTVQSDTSGNNHIIAMEAEIQELKKEVGELTHYIAMDSVRHTKDTIFSYDANEKHIKLKSGNYVVLQLCKTRDFANKLVKMYKAKGIATYLAYNESQGVFYIIEKQFSDFETARYEMEKMRKAGHKNSWVMVY